MFVFVFCLFLILYVCAQCVCFLFPSLSIYYPCNVKRWLETASQPESLTAQHSGFIAFPTMARKPWLTFQLKKWMFLISPKKRCEVHTDLWTPVLLPLLGHSCEIVLPRLKHQGSPAAVCAGECWRWLCWHRSPGCFWSSLWMSLEDGGRGAEACSFHGYSCCGSPPRASPPLSVPDSSPHPSPNMRPAGLVSSLWFQLTPSWYFLWM